MMAGFKAGEIRAAEPLKGHGDADGDTLGISFFREASFAEGKMTMHQDLLFFLMRLEEG